MIKKISILLFILISFTTYAFGSRDISNYSNTEPKMKILNETESSVVFLQKDGRVVELPKNPQRAVIALNSILDVWYMAGGESIARLNGSINVPEEAENLPILGSISTVNIELLMELQPDFLVTTTSSYQDEVKDIFEQEGVPTVSISYNNFADFCVIFDLFTRLTGERELYENYALEIEMQVNSVINQVPEGEAPTICILFASTRYVKVETQNTITGSTCQQLGAINIYQESAIEEATRVDLSLEYILEQDPDIIFVTTMGDIDKCKSRMEQDVISSDIWGGLSAVKEGRFYYLDKSYSIYKPNRFYPEAYKTMAQFLYPDINFEI